MGKRTSDRRRKNGRLPGERGQTMVEFAMILPLLLLVLLGILEFGRLFYGFNTLQNAVRYAADTASKNPPHIGAAVPDDPEGRYYAQDPSQCGLPGEEPCYLVNIREAVRRYAILFTPQDPHIKVYFLPVGDPPDELVTNEPGGLVEVEINYNILPITPILREFAPYGIPVVVDSRRTIINVSFPYEAVTPIHETPPPSPTPTTPIPGCGGKYTVSGESVSGNVYSFDITNNTGGDNRGIIGLIAGWCPDVGQLLSVSIGGVPLSGLPASPPSISLPGGGIVIHQGETLAVVMTFENNLNQIDQNQWPSWHITFDDYCMLWSPGRNCPFPTPTSAPTQAPTDTPEATYTPSPGPSGTVPPICGMYISSGPIFTSDSVIVNITNGGDSSPVLESIIVLWGPGMYPLQNVTWNGASVWNGTKYYSAFLSGLSGDFPSGSTRTLQFNYNNGPLSWLSFQSVFDNDCYVSFSDPMQPTPPPLPTLTPTPAPGEIVLEITDLDPAMPACTEDTLNARAIAYMPQAGYDDGDGIQRVTFRIYDPDGDMVYEHAETQSWFCLNSGNGPCNPLDISAPSWISGTYTLEVTAQALPAYGGHSRTESAPFRICKVPPPPLHLEIVSFSPPSCGSPFVNARAVAWDPQVCEPNCQDGNGITYVYFDVTQSWDSKLVFRHREGAACYCMGNGDCPCPGVDFGSGIWPRIGGGSDYGNEPVISGTHTLTVWAQAADGRTASVSQSFNVCWDPCGMLTLEDRYLSGNSRITLEIRNNSGQNRRVTHIHVEDWPAGWGELEQVRVLGSWYDVYDDTPPADRSVNRTLNANSSGTIVLRFENNVNDANAVSGYIELDNGCRIYY